ncbi:hypothetical protein ABEB36_000568 [Hypothenemus hampei]|uniref:UDP-glucuronosyltransferase n=1 Tax=Hypothenemus hampei TaxID=57062 RepID=A0ABD1FBP7_HYPHA
MMKIIIFPFLFLFVFYSIFCESYRILGIVPTPSYSHQLAYKNLWNELALKGHNVTVITTNPQNNTNLHEIDFSSAYNLWHKKYDYKNLPFSQDTITFLLTIYDMLADTANHGLDNPELQRLYTEKNSTFDLVMVEELYPEFLMLGEFFNCPTVTLTSYESPSWIFAAYDSENHPILYPEFFVPHTNELDFKYRLTSTLSYLLLKYIKHRSYSARYVLLKKRFGTNAIPLDDLLSRSSMMFISVSPLLMSQRALSARIVNIGVGSTIETPRPLDAIYQRFLDSSSQGAIYFSLGTNVQPELFPTQIILQIFELFRELPYNIMWKINFKDEEFIKKKPKNVLTDSWFPQQDILRHPNIKLFVTQGGMQSLEEAIHFKIPLVGIPMFADQISNVKRMETKGVLFTVLPKPELSISKLKEAILTVINDQSYYENMKKLNKRNMDQPMTGLERGVWWTEYVIRHHGDISHLVHLPSKKIGFFQYYLLDIISLMILTVGVMLWAFYALVKRIFSHKQDIYKKNR